MKEISSRNSPTMVDDFVLKHPVRIGCAGWSVPRDASSHFTSEGSHLIRYARVLNCCEINSSFYRPHKQTTWERWADSVPERFRFSVKAPRAITHDARLDCTSQVLLAFLRQITLLRNKLGPVLFQLPPSLEFDFALATQFLSLLRENYSGDVVWEPRHATWFDDSADSLLRAFKIAQVAADPACVPAAGLPGGLSDLVYFRLHGSPHRYYSAYTAEYLSALYAQIERLGSTAQVWCIFDNTASGSAIQNAMELTATVQKLNRR